MRSVNLVQDTKVVRALVNPCPPPLNIFPPCRLPKIKAATRISKIAIPKLGLLLNKNLILHPIGILSDDICKTVNQIETMPQPCLAHVEKMAKFRCGLGT
jgi:hypothetical protein